MNVINLNQFKPLLNTHKYPIPPSHFVHSCAQDNIGEYTTSYRQRCRLDGRKTVSEPIK